MNKLDNKLNTARMFFFSHNLCKNPGSKKKGFFLIKCRVHHYLKPGFWREKNPEENIFISKINKYEARITQAAKPKTVQNLK